MASVTWETSTISTVISTDMNSLANASRALSSEINNASGLYLFDDVQLSLGAFGSTPSAGGVVELYIVAALDGTNYEDGNASTDPPIANLVGVFNIRASTAAQIHTLRQIPIPPVKYKYLVINKTGQTFNASGNTLKVVSYRYKSDLTGFSNTSNYLVTVPGCSILILRKNTTNENASEMFLDSNSQRMTIPSKTTWTFLIKLSAHLDDTTNSGAGWIFKGVIRNKGGSPNETLLIGDVIEESWKDSALQLASASVTADDTNDSLKIEVTGIASKNILWAAVVEISESAYGTL